MRLASPTLASAFGRFYRQLDDNARARIKVCIRSYPFTARILDTGTPYWPDGSKVQDDFIVAKGLPLGVILSRSCEIFDYTIPLLPKSPRPTALLSKGDCIGVFELFDEGDDEAHGGKPDWSISAGSINVRNPVNFNAAAPATSSRGCSAISTPITFANADPQREGHVHSAGRSDAGGMAGRCSLLQQALVQVPVRL
ncbi:MAG: hypothetical protein HC871_13375 [Rhizobiales bacterium]|nr:hypothetical protein [Hyphomicrobiales bacterium]